MFSPPVGDPFQWTAHCLHWKYNTICIKGFGQDVEGCKVFHLERGYLVFYDGHKTRLNKFGFIWNATLNLVRIHPFLPIDNSVFPEIM